MSSDRRVMGWDIGGAHLKVALAEDERVRRLAQIHTPLWRGLEHLDSAVEAIKHGFPVSHSVHRVTMTGELADVFATRAEGVATLTRRLAHHLSGLDVALYAGPRGLLAPDSVAAHSEWVASANWHATAALIGQRLEAALLVDVGSTTTDIVAVCGGEPVAQAWSDHARLRCEALVYSGVVRTPVMAIAERVPVDGEWVGLAAEHFATAADIYRLTGELPPHADLGDTADGRAKGQAESAARLARMIGEDACKREPEIWRAIARYLRGCQLERLRRACARQCSTRLAPGAPIVGAGTGRFLLRDLSRALNRDYIDFADLVGRPAGAAAAETSLGSAVSDDGVDAADCAPAAALALLCPPGAS